MENLFQLNDAPKVFNPGFIARLAEANAALRKLRQMGCRVIRLQMGDLQKATEIVVDRNPHQLLTGCPSVHVTCGGWQ